MTTPRTLDLAAPILPGRTVVEASAGTGKTYAIAALVCRLVAAEGIPLERILVVTFTRAATAELRHRVRTRLVETIRALDGDEGLGRLREALSPATPADSEDHRSRLVAAVSRFDQAQIFTIHGFAHRLLGHLGFRARIAAGSEPGAVDEALLAQVASDLVVGRFASREDGVPAVSAGDVAEIGRVVTGVPDGRMVPEAAEVEGLARARVELAHAAEAEVRRRMRRAEAMSYDDGLVEVRAALQDPAVAGEARSLLADRYAVALVDECQDTDAVQWQVIDQIFGQARLVIIGDPKQSIYSFRGADIHSYLAAAERADHPRTLDTNWRSDGPLLEALDRILGGATFGDDRIAYRRVEPAPDAAAGRIHGVGAPLAISTFAADYPIERARSGPYLVDPARREVAGHVAARVVSLLGGGVTIDAPVGRRDLTAGDIAVLCRTRRQVEMVRKELRARRVPAVAAQTGGVFGSDGAEEWRRLLRAVERPDSIRAVKLAATTALAGGWSPTLGPIPDEEVLSLQLACRRWHTLLQDSGVPALFADLERRSGVSARVLGRPDGERLMTDLTHVAEEMHAVWRRGRIGSLVGWLEEAMADARRREESWIEEPEARQRRLETDADAVHVLTVHGAKGLEFPVVLLPYGWDVPIPDPPVPVFHGPAGADGARPRLIDVGGRGWAGFRADLAAAQAESRAEEGRLLYVAMTRARHHLVVWWLPEARTARGSKLGELLDAAGLTGASGVDGIEVEMVHAPAQLVEHRSADPGAADLTRATFDRTLDQSWRRASFSSLSPDHPLAPTAGHAEQELHLDEDTADADEPEPAAAAGLPMADLPRGARFGTLVHDVLEHVDFGAADLAGQVRGRVADALADPTWDFDGEALVEGLVGAIETPLGPSPADPRLADLGGAVLDELRFEFPVRGAGTPVSLADIGSVMADHLPPGHPFAGYAAELGRMSGAPFRGFLTGAIDLTARVPDGDATRYVVFDYKSNVLPVREEAASASDYGPGPLHEAMAGGHYVLQATIYQVALHRYLQWRLRGYEPGVHLGGAVYLFLRGMTGVDTPVIDGERCGVVRWRPPPEMIVELSAMLAGRER